MKPPTQIHAICSAVEKAGACTSAHIKDTLGMRLVRACQGLSRAADMGLLTVDRSEQPHVYEVVPQWRELWGVYAPLNTRRAIPSTMKAGESMVSYAMRTQPNSVFNQVRGES